MANGGRIDYTIGFNVDKSGLNEIKKNLEDIKKLTATDILNLNPNVSSMSQAKSVMTNLRVSIHEIETAFKQAFDPTIGITNINKLNQNLQKLDLNKISTNFKKIGPEGEKAFSQIAAKAMTTNLQFKQTNNILDKMGTTFMNTIKWTISSSIIKKITGTFTQAIGYVEHLDSSLNDIRIVTKKSADEMDDFAAKANKAAQALGKATTDYTEAALIYYQQGLSDEEVKARAETTLKAANVTGQATKTVSEQLTSVWNGFRVNAEQTEEYVDKLAAVAATTASNLEELSTGMSKVASAAANLGIDIDQLTAQISTIVSVTRQAPESVGTALKTIYARISDLKLGETDEDGLGLGDVSGGLKKLGIEVLDSKGELRDLGTVIEEVAEKWNTWTSAQQAAIAQLMAGKRQYNNLVALFSNWDMYTNAIETSRNATGELQKQQDIYMESTEAHLQKMKTEWEDLYDSILDKDTINDIADGLTSILDKIVRIVNAMGGGKGLLLGFSALLTKVFNQQISAGLENIITKFKNVKDNAAQLKADLDTTKMFAQNLGANPEAVDRIVQLKQSVQQYYDVMSQEEIQAKNNLIEQAAKIEIIKQDWDNAAKSQQNYVKGLADSQLGHNSTFKSSSGQYQNVQNMDIIKGQGIEEANKAVQNSMDSAEKMSESYNKVKQAYLQYIEALKNGEGVTKAFKNMEKAEQEWNKAEQEFIINANIDEKTQDKLNLSYNKLVASIDKLTEAYANNDNASKRARGGRSNAVNKALVEENSLVEEIIRNVIEMGNKFNEELPKIAQGYEEASGKANNFKNAIQATKEFDLRQNIQQITSFVSGLSTIGFSIQSLISITKTWGDETLSTGEKITQTLISTGMIIPGVVKAVEALSAARLFLTSVTQAQLAEEGETILLEGVSIGSVVGKTLALEALNEKEAFYTGLLGKTKKQIADEIAELNADTLATILNTEAKQGNVAVTTAMGKGIKTSTGLLGKLSTGLSKIGISGAGLGIAAAGIAAIGVEIWAFNKAIDAQIAHIAELAEKRAENAQKATEEAEQEVENTKKVKEEYKNLSKQYEDRSISIDTFRDKVHDLAIQYGDEELAIKSLTASYEDLNNAILELDKNSNEEYRRSIEAEQDALQNKLSNVIWRDLKGSEQNETEIAPGVFANTLDLEGTYGDNINIDKGIIQGLRNLGVGYYGYGQINMDDLAHVLTYNYDELEALLNSSTDEGAKRLQEIIDEHKEDIERAKKLVSEEEKAKKTERLDTLEQDTNKVENKDEAQSVWEKYKTQAEAEGLSVQEAREEFEKFATESENAFIKSVAKEQEIKQSLIDAYSGGMEFGSGTAIQNKVDEALKRLQEAGINLDEFDTSILSSDDWKRLLSDGLNDVDIEEISTALRTKIDQTRESTRNYFIQKELTNFSNEFDSFVSKAIEGEVSAEDEAYTKLVEKINSVKDAFPEYTAQIEQFTNKGLIGTEQWIQATQDLQDIFDNLEFKELNEKFKDEIKDISPELDTTDFKNELDDILNADYEINIEIHSDAERDFENIEKALSDIDSMSSKIGEDFIVAATDLRELNNTFPGILNGMEYLADGTVRLNQEVVESAMQSANAEAQASTEATITKLKNSATELRNKADVYDQMAQMAYDGAKSEAAAEDAKQKIVAKLDELQTQNNETVTNAEIDNANLVVDNSATNSPILASNWSKAYEKAAQYANDWAAVATAANAAAANGDTSWNPPKTNFGVDFKGQTHASSERGIKAQIQNSPSDAKTMIAIGDQFKDQATSYRNMANDTEGMIAELGAKAIDTINKNSKTGKSETDESSSSGGSEKEAQHMDNIEREEDIYREINTELDNIESTLGRIQTIDEHSWGESQKKALKEEQKLLDKQIATLERKQKMQVGDLSTRRKQLEDVGVTFSSDGSVMTNAEGVLNQLYAGYNQMVQRYNNMSAAEQDAYKAQMDTEKNRIDAIEKAIGEYESGYSDLQGTLDELQSKHYEQIETNVREFNHDIDVHLELSDAKKEWNDFWEEVVEDVDDNDFGKKIAGSMKQLENLVGLGGSGSGIVGELTNHLTETVDMVQAQLARASSGGDGVFEDDTAASHDNLVKYRDELMSALRDAKGEVDEIRENYFNMLDEAQEKIEKQQKGWENIRKQLEHNVNLIKLIDGEKAYDALNKQYKLRHKNNLETIETNKQAAEWSKQRMEAAKKILDTADKDTQEWKDARKEYEKESENWLKNLDAFNQSVEQALKDTNEQIELLTNQTFDKLEKSLTKGLGFDAIEDEWKLINDYANSYFDNVERYINMEEYTNTLNDAANAIGLSAENQQKLNEFRDQELNKLRSLNKLTAYDIEESKARLEIMKAQMALEDAQRNKSNLRLRRDSQGNYNYQYVENADAVDEANQNSLAAQKAWYEIVKKQNLDLKEQRIQATKDVYEYTQKANEALRAGDIERYNKYTELARIAEEKVKFIQEQAAKNSKDLYDGVAQYFDNVNEAYILKQNEATISQLMDEWVGGGEESFTGALTTAFNELQEINEEYGRQTKDVFDQAGIDLQKFRDTGLDPTINTLQTLVDTNEDFKDMLDETSDSLAEQERNLRDAEDAYNDLKDAAVQAIEAANNALGQLATTAVSATSQVTAAINAAKQASAITYNTVYPSSSTGGSGTGSSNNGSGGSNNSYANNAPYEITISDTAGAHTMRYSAFNKNDIYNVMAPYATGKYMQMWVIKGTNRADLTGSPTKDELRKRINGISFDTGGYTGDWNSNSGRLAMLHQKELVLNASDTRNMLSAVEILRSLPIEALAKSIIASSSNIASSFASGVNISGITGGVTNNDSKNMVINADFSGVSSADEIYKAFLSLENYGIQQSYSVIPNIN